MVPPERPKALEVRTVKMPPDELARAVDETRAEPFDEALTSPGVPTQEPEFPAPVRLEEDEADPPSRRWLWAAVGIVTVLVALMAGVVARRSTASRPRPQLATPVLPVVVASTPVVAPAPPDAGAPAPESPAAEAPKPIEVKPAPVAPVPVPQDRVVATPPESPKPVAFEWTLPGRYEVGVARPHASRALSASVLRRVVNKALKQCGGQLVITGYSCTIGSEASRARIGLERAQAMAQRLVRLGVPTSALRVVSMGAANPVASNNTVAGRARNRRVTLSCPE